MPFMTEAEERAAADFIAVNIAAGAERAEQANCAEHGHSWAPRHGRLECSRCSLSPHTREDLT